ncbi:hypothetical protein [Cetobacterium somerae]
MAPTAKNQQPQEIYILQSKESLDKLSELTPCVNVKIKMVLSKVKWLG